ncbi:hypothetical protein [Photobacterium chitinilyticum]|uniref:Uncharacterized protein n=1 Tax=Photobacterium chitinilyticum TaxID=2485123 RepID=A0A444JIJ2_9GAMM|nr:hypothetical protein [Photobacterium chitinilyticum]RWX52902.1 hypothetical protein EDI28_24895 [Photobacterium chitinilyticum]
MKNEPANNNFDIQRYLEGYKKLRLKPVHNKDYFLPALTCFIELFGASSSVRTMIRCAEKQLQVSSGISDSSLDNFSRQGVGKKTAEKFFRFIFQTDPQTFTQLESQCETQDTIYESDNYWPWLGVICNLQGSEENELALCIDFLTKRCQQNKQINNYCRAMKEKETSNAEVLNKYFERTSAHTLLSDEEKTAFSEGIVSELNNPRGEATEKAVLAMLQYRLDFYFHLMASFEVGILKLWLELDEDIPNRVPDFYQNGFFSSIAHIHSHSSPFNRFLDGLKERFNPQVLNGYPSLSGSKLAAFIPVDKSDEQYVTLHEAQKRQLRKWRERNAYPSLETLECLISDLFGFKDQIPVIAKSLANIGLICIGLDRQHKQLLQHKEISPELLSKAYGSYPRYWQQYRQHI